MKSLFAGTLLSAAALTSVAATFDAANAINALGVDLLRQAGGARENSLLSPYSIQSALAMTCAGAGGATREEMARVLHYPDDDSEVARSFASLHHALYQIVKQSCEEAEQQKKWGGSLDPIQLSVANRLFGQTGYDFRQAFLDFEKTNYDAPFEPMDFKKDAPGATRRINSWVEEQTRERIRNLIPGGALDGLTRLVLVNAIYLKAPWAKEFPAGGTEPRLFFTARNGAKQVPTMTETIKAGYSQREGYAAVTIPYRGGELQLLILLPDKTDGLADMEKSLTPDLLAGCAKLPEREIVLFLPKFKLEPPTVPLGDDLKALGMKSAFDLPSGSANFDRIAPRRGGDYLYISEVFHKTFISLDEKGTEAAAATAVAMRSLSIAIPASPPPEVRVDHAFLFAIQHKASGACLFLGRLTDPEPSSDGMNTGAEKKK